MSSVGHQELASRVKDGAAGGAQSAGMLYASGSIVSAFASAAPGNNASTISTARSMVKNRFVFIFYKGLLLFSFYING